MKKCLVPKPADVSGLYAKVGFMFAQGLVLPETCRELDKMPWYRGWAKVKSFKCTGKIQGVFIERARLACIHFDNGAKFTLQAV